VTRKQLNTDLRSTGLFFPIDPGADASIGGMASTRASGTSAVRYGTMKDNILGLTVVMPDGTICKTGTRARKSSAGYDMTRLFIGAEGTLGVITELTVRLHGIPAHTAVAVCAFPTLRAACDTVIAAIRFGLRVERIELMDDLQVRACNAYSGLTMQERPTLFVEFGGSETVVNDQLETFRELAGEFGSLTFEDASAPDERQRLWTARHDVYWACLQLRPGTKFLATDVCVPISRLADCMVETHEDIAATGLVAPIVGHVGDGNFHASVMADTENPEEMERIKAFIDRLNSRAIAMDGTCTGEHGIGEGKRRFLRQELGVTVDYMRLVKRAFDPNNIMNPGKVFEA
jgi:D-lactate dehydrogenase (cytochrome)